MINKNKLNSCLIDSYGTNVPQNDEGGEITSTCHTEEQSDVSIHKVETQPQNSEGYQPSLDSYGTNVPQNDRVAESGRSMVEMLGVLAIIGVLSITAIAGYSYAMTKNKANQIISGLSKAQVMVMSALSTGTEDIYLPQSGTPTSLSKTILNGYGLDNYNPVATGCTEETFDVVLNDIPVDICEMLVADGVGTYIAVDVRDNANENRNKYCHDLSSVNTSCTINDETVQIAFTFEIKTGQGVDENRCTPVCTGNKICLPLGE